MPADLDSSKDDTQAPGTQESVTNQTQSPLEAASAFDKPESPPPPSPVYPEGSGAGQAEPVAAPPPAADTGAQTAPAPSTAAPQGGGEQSAAVPDTEEFLQSILGDAPKDTPSTSAPAPETPPAPIADVPPPPSAGQAQPETVPTAPPTPETPEVVPPAPETLSDGAETTVAPQAPEAGAEKSVQDNTSDLDSILQGESTPEGPKPADEAAGETPSGKPISQDIVGSMSQAPASSKSPLKLIGLIVLVVVIGVGGYFAYTTLVSPSSTNKSTSSKVTSPTPVAEATVTLDGTRKTDLVSLQEALKNYYAGAGSYPLSENWIFLTDGDNVLKSELVESQKLLDKIPLDPAYPTRKYGYMSDGKTFTLSAVLDDASDPGVVVENGLNLYKITQDSVVTGESASALSAEEPATSAGDESGLSDESSL